MEWKDIKGYENYYQISNNGQVKNIKTNKILTGDINSAGYKRVILYTPNKKRFFIHRLVAEHFCNKPLNYKELVVNHIDGNKLNNDYKNLEFITRSENDKHAFKLNLRKPYPAQYKREVIAIKNDEIILFNTTLECSKYFKTTPASIRAVCNVYGTNKQYLFKGYILKYNNL